MISFIVIFYHKTKVRYSSFNNSILLQHIIRKRDNLYWNLPSSAV